MLAAWLAVGCGKPTGEVSGVVTYNGEPLPSGTVLFVGAGPPNEGKADPVSQIQSDGRYHIPRVVCDDVRIIVQTPPVMKGPKARPSIEIPKHYADPEKSGLTYTVTPGPQTFDLKLSGPTARPAGKSGSKSIEEREEERKQKRSKEKKEQK
ncbi:MAG TPA: hypothetical protein VH682_16785 [Gemmataceae bacterium]